MSDFLLLGILGAAGHYLLWRALITKWLWSRYPAWLDPFIACSACTGFWIGAGAGLYWRFHGISKFNMHPEDPLLVLVAALVCLVTAPVIAWLQITALERLGGAGGEETAD